MKIIFISDGSVTNPILHSQGLPILQTLGNESYFISFETQSKEDFSKYYEKQLKDNFNRVKFYPIFLKGFLPLGIENIILGVIKIISLIFNKRISIVHSRSLIPTFVGIISKFILLGKISVIYDNRGVLIEEEIFKGNWRRDSFKVSFFFLIEKIIIKYSNHIVVVSNSFKNYILTKYDLLSLENKISVIPNGTEIIRRKENYNVKSDKEIICVYSGSSAPWQKNDSVFEMFSMAKNVLREIKFKIITYEKEIFEAKAKNYPSISSSIKLINVPSKKVNDELEKCNFGILIRDNNVINNVASPLKFAEYLAAGLPVIVSENVGDTEEIINKYNVGVILRDSNYKKAIYEIIELLKDEQIKERCKMVAEKEFNLENSIKMYKKIYTQINNT